ncbi:hypothetical protein JCM16358_12520 [Halanaerocella petrolearia]
MENLEEEFIEIDLKEYFKIILRYKWLLIILVMIAILGSLFITSQLTKIYQTSALVMVKKDQEMSSLFSSELSIAGLNSQTNKVATYSRILKSRRILQKVINDLNLKNQDTEESIELKTLRNKINVNRETEDNLITITVNYSDPVVAKKIANTVLEKFKIENQKINQVELSGANKFISSQLKQVENRLKNIEDKLLQYKENKNVVLPQKQGEMILDELTKLQSAQAKASVELKQSKASLKEVKKQLASQDKEIVSTRTITSNPLVKQYRSQLADLEVKLAGLKESYRNSHPKINQIKTKIKQLKNRLQEVVKEVVSSKTKTINPMYNELKQKLVTLHTRIISVTTQLNTYQQQIDQVKSKLTALPEKELKLSRLKREKMVTESVYTMLRERKEEIEIQKAMKTSNIVVIDPAVIKEDPIKPKVKLNVALATILSVFIGLGIIFIVEYLDTTIKNKEEVEQLTDLPVLGVIPDIKTIDQEYRRGDN